MVALLLLAWLGALLPFQNAAPTRIDVSTLTMSPPTIVTEIDMGKLKGQPRRLAWGPDLQVLYLQTAEGDPPALTLHHYTIQLAERTLKRVDAEPPWAAEYWTFKQDRAAPGVPLLAIDVEQTYETVKAGPGPAGVLDRESTAGGVIGSNPSPENLGKGTHGDEKMLVRRLRLLGEELGVWKDEPFNAGAKFGWGPPASGAVVHVDEDGRLVFFDEHKRRHVVPGVRNALLPAWSRDGARLAYLQKTGRKTYAVACMDVAH